MLMIWLSLGFWLIGSSLVFYDHDSVLLRVTGAGIQWFGILCMMSR